MFERKSQIVIEKEKASEDKLMDMVLEAGADDLRDDGDSWEVLSAPEAHEAVLEAHPEGRDPHLEAAIAMVPKNLMKLEGQERAGHAEAERALEEHDDVQNVYSNFDIDEKELEAMADRSRR